MTENEEFYIPDTMFEPPTPVVLSDTPSTLAAPWPSRLPFDIALGIDGMTILEERYDLSSDQIVYLMAVPEFQRQVRQHRDEILANGVGFKQKAKLQAETYLAEVDIIVADKSISAAVRMDAIKSTVKWAGLSNEGKDSGSGVESTTRLVFQWQDGSGQVAIEMKTSVDEVSE